jgi:hypothetical protein
MLWVFKLPPRTVYSVLLYLLLSIFESLKRELEE